MGHIIMGTGTGDGSMLYTKYSNIIISNCNHCLHADCKPQQTEHPSDFVQEVTITQYNQEEPGSPLSLVSTSPLPDIPLQAATLQPDVDITTTIQPDPAAATIQSDPTIAVNPATIQQVSATGTTVYLDPPTSFPKKHKPRQKSKLLDNIVMILPPLIEILKV